MNYRKYSSSLWTGSLVGIGWKQAEESKGNWNKGYLENRFIYSIDGFFLLLFQWPKKIIALSYRRFSMSYRRIRKWPKWPNNHARLCLFWYLLGVKVTRCYAPKLKISDEHPPSFLCGSPLRGSTRDCGAFDPAKVAPPFSKFALIPKVPPLQQQQQQQRHQQQHSLIIPS